MKLFLFIALICLSLIQTSLQQRQSEKHEVSLQDEIRKLQEQNLSLFKTVTFPYGNLKEVWKSFKIKSSNRCDAV